jgi:hypothetical protein
MCTNPLCGHCFVVEHIIARTISPSAIPRSGLHIPLSPRMRKRLVKQLELGV